VLQVASQPTCTICTHACRIQETNAAINAMPITCWERAKQKAQQLMEQGFPAQTPRGYLFGEGCSSATLYCTHMGCQTAAATAAGSTNSQPPRNHITLAQQHGRSYTVDSTVMYVMQLQCRVQCAQL
jgi:hypothetical protein